MSDRRNDRDLDTDAEYTPPVAEDLETDESPAASATGATQTPA